MPRYDLLKIHDFVEAYYLSILTEIYYPGIRMINLDLESSVD